MSQQQRIDPAERDSKFVQSDRGATAGVNAGPSYMEYYKKRTADDNTPTGTDSAAPTATSGSVFPICHNKDGDGAPFCKPENNSIVYVGEFDLPPSHQAKDKWAACPCCRPHHTKYCKRGKIAWFPKQRIASTLLKILSNNGSSMLMTMEPTQPAEGQPEEAEHRHENNSLRVSRPQMIEVAHEPLFVSRHGASPSSAGARPTCSA